MHCLPERGEGTSTPSVIPHAGSDRSAGAGDPAHLREPVHGISHEMHNKLGQRGVERPVSKRKLLGNPAYDADPWEAVADGRKEGRGWIDRADGTATEPLQELCRQRPRPAADLQNPLTSLHTGQLSELHSQRLGETTHEPGVRIWSDVKYHRARLRVASTRRPAVRHARRTPSWPGAALHRV